MVEITEARRLETAGMVARVCDRRTAALIAAVLAGALLSPAWAAHAAPNPSGLVLRLSDLPAGFKIDTKETGVFSNARAAISEHNPKDRANFKRWGRLTGYRAQFTRSARTGRFGSLVRVTSRASLFKAPSGAAASFAEVPARCSGGTAHTVSLGVTLGQRSFACSELQDVGVTTFRVYAVYWQQRRVEAALVLVWVEGGIAASDAAALAKAQERHITAALGG